MHKVEVHCLKDDLLKGVQLVQNAISTRSTLPVLSNILVETNGGNVRLSSTDLEVGIRCFVKADIQSAGNTTVPAKTLSEFLRTLDEGKEISFKSDDNQKIEIRSGRDRCVLMGLPKDDYPVLPEFTQEKSISVPQPLFRDMLRKTAFSVSTDETRYILNGVNFLLDNGKLILVSTDGRRLALVRREVADKTSKANAVIPSKAVNELLHILATDDRTSEVQIAFTDNQVTFRHKSTILLSRLIDGHFPNFEQVIPKSKEITLSFNVKALLAATQRAAVGTMDRGGSVRFSLSPQKLQISAAAQGRVEVEAEMDVEYGGGPFTIAFNPQYLIDGLRVLEGQDILLDLTTPLNPGVIRPVGDDGYIYVVMPMQPT